MLVLGSVFERENHLPDLHFWVPCSFSGVYFILHICHTSATKNNRSMRYMSKLQDQSKKIPTDPWTIPEVKVPQNAIFERWLPNHFMRWKSGELVLCSAGMLEFSLYQFLPSDPFGYFK